MVVKIGSAISIRQQPRLSNDVVIGALLATDGRRGEDAEWYAKDSWFEDSLRAQELDALAFEIETLQEDTAVKKFCAKVPLKPI